MCLQSVPGGRGAALALPNPRNTSSYFTHHVAAISNALVNAEAIILLDAGARLTRDLTGTPGAA